MPTRPHAVPSSPTAVPVAPRAWLVLGVMTAFNVLNFVDRQLIPSLAPLLIADLGLRKADIGLLVGFAFVFFYTVVGMGLGVAADRWPRRGLIGWGLALWSAMTALSGAARGFLGLAVPRVLVGVGEATLTPAALSMLGDLFPVRRLGVATSLYYTGLPLGTALSLVVAGLVAPRFGWRACFYALGLVGLAAVPLLLFVREPVRRGVARMVPDGPPASLRRIAADLVGAMRSTPALGLVMLGGAGLAYGSASAMHGVTWLVQERGFTFERAVFVSGLMAVCAGLAGTIAGGWWSDWCRRRWEGGRAWSLALLTLFFAPFSAAFYLLPPSASLFYVCWFFSSASTVAYFGPVYAAVQELAPVHIRSSALACGILVVNIVGVGPGPWITGLIGDRADLTLGLLVSVGVGVGPVGPFIAAARFTRVGPATRGPSA